VSAFDILDIVDGDDRIIGARPRGEVHRLQLRHRAVHILVFNPQGELFLQRRSVRKDVAPGLWDTSAAGHLDQGESYDSAASRELREELGIADEPLSRRFKLTATAATGWEFVWVYRCNTGQRLQIDSEEIAEGVWLTPAELGEALAREPERFTITFRLLWRHYRAASSDD
jgi:isopentenyl-diphosphate delta-isomerase type 1